MLKVNLGSGAEALEDWDNLDISYNIWLSKHMTLKRILFKLGLLDEEHFKFQWPSHIRRYNIIKGLPYKNCSVDFIYASHFLEHVSRESAINILRESYRVLKPAGMIRIVVPDLRIIAENYLKNNSEFFEIWSGECISDKFLRSIGFGSKKQSSICVGAYERFARAPTSHKWMYGYDSLSQILGSLGFRDIESKGFRQGKVPDIEILDNRPEESLYLEASK